VERIYNSVGILNLCRVDGGVSNNDFICQTIANLSGKPVIRPICREMTALGCAFMAGVNCGMIIHKISNNCPGTVSLLLNRVDFWKSKDLLEKYYKIDKVFHPKQEYDERIQHRFADWERALERFLKWNKEPLPPVKE
jgi:putative glycerol kinase 5